MYHASSVNYIWKTIGKWNIIFISSNITFRFFFILLSFGFEYVSPFELSEGYNICVYMYLLNL